MLKAEIKELAEMLPDELKSPDELTRHEEEEYQIQQLKEFEEKKLTTPRPTGFSSLDDVLLGGLRDGDLMIISGLSGRGKSHLTLQMIKQFSERGIPVLLFSFEEPISRIKWRLSDMGAKEDIYCFAPKKLKSGHVEWLEQKILDGLANYLIRVVAIDNLDFLTAESQKNNEDKWTIQSRIVAMLKRIAIEHKVTIILNAHVKKLEDSSPRMEDLYGSGDTYKLADFVMFIHRLKEEKTRDNPNPPFTNVAELIIEKNRLTGQLKRFKIELKDNLFVEL